MAYTPPLGNAANFSAAGTSYVPPAGNAVDFSSFVSGDANTSLSFEASASGAIGTVSAGVSTTLTLVVSGEGIDVPYGRSESFELTFVGSSTGLVDRNGAGSAQLAFTASATGAMSRVGAVSSALSFVVSSQGATRILGQASTSFQPAALGSGGFYAPGACLLYTSPSPRD